MKKSTKIIWALIAVIAVIVVAVLGYVGYNLVQNDINGIRGNETSYTLEITANDFEYEVGKKLKNNGIIMSDTIWTNWMSKHYPDFTYINGEYNLHSYMTYEDIAQSLQNPDVSHKTVKVCIPEGTNVMEIAELLQENDVCDAKDFLDACRDADDYDYDFLSSIPNNEFIAYQLEGFLFPATYDFAQNSEPKDVASEMLEAFDYHLTDDMQDFCKKHDMTLYELITLASVVQEEAFSNSSAENIASVFINRLNSGAKLQSDVTYFYARDLRDNQGFSQKVYDAYYTYRCTGLPAGPITNSGDAIMSATINAPKTEYIYFFSDLNKEFHFAKTYDEFEKQKDTYEWE